jgi:hypothetical protein
MAVSVVLWRVVIAAQSTTPACTLTSASGISMPAAVTTAAAVTEPCADECAKACRETETVMFMN